MGLRLSALPATNWLYHLLLPLLLRLLLLLLYLGC
jgi:hypothetical protein